MFGKDAGREGGGEGSLPRCLEKMRVEELCERQLT